VGSKTQSVQNLNSKLR